VNLDSWHSFCKILRLDISDNHAIFFLGVVKRIKIGELFEKKY